MNEEKAKEILESALLKNSDMLFSLGWYLSWAPENVTATLDGEFSAEDLEAIAWWMRNKQKK